jgi:Protein of unknown function (DUF2849)
VKILTGNDLKSGDVTWWTGSGWSRHIADAVDAGDEVETILARESAAQLVNAAYVIDAERTADGIRPAHIKERIRALGPTVRLDLSLDPTATPERVL